MRLLATLLVLLLSPYAIAGGVLLTLEQAISRAMGANHAMLGQQYRTALAGLDYERAQSVLKPQIRSFASSDARSGAEIGSRYGLVMDRQLASGASLGIGYYNSSFGDKHLSEMRFSYRLPFFGGRGEKIRGDLDDARFSFQHQKNRMKVAAIELKREIARYYYSVMLANDQLALAEQLSITTAKRLEATQIRHEGGQASQLDLRKASISSIRSRQRLSSTRENQITAASNLKIAIGARLDERIVVDDYIQPTADWSLADLPLDELFFAAQRNRLDLMLARREMLRLKERMNNERKTLLPNVEVSLQYSLISEDDTFGGGYSFNEGRFGVGLKMNTDFNRSKKSNEQRRKSLDLANRQREFQRSLSLVNIDIQRAQASVHSRRDELSLASELTELALEEHHRGLLLAAGGQLDSLSLLDLEQRIDESRHMQRAARIALVSSDYELRLAVGEQL